jgi:two-component sensor histidine kinase
MTQHKPRASRQLGLLDEAVVLNRLSEWQGELVSEILTRAAEADRARQETARLQRDLAGSWDRLQEVHHRVRNHLQTLTGLLSAQKVAETSPTARRALQTTVARLASIAAIHDLLARDPTSGALRLPDLAQRLGEHLLRQAGVERRVRMRCDVADLTLGAKEATPFVLILSELIDNAIEHGFPGERGGEIAISLRAADGEAVLEVRDTGCGLPEGFDLEQGNSLGLRLVARLAERDLGGAIEAKAGPGGQGTHFTVRFPTRGPGDTP